MKGDASRAGCPGSSCQNTASLSPRSPLSPVTKRHHSFSSAVMHETKQQQQTQQICWTKVNTLVARTFASPHSWPRLFLTDAKLITAAIYLRISFFPYLLDFWMDVMKLSNPFAPFATMRTINGVKVLSVANYAYMLDFHKNPNFACFWHTLF